MSALQDLVKEVLPEAEVDLDGDTLTIRRGEHTWVYSVPEQGNQTLWILEKLGHIMGARSITFAVQCAAGRISRPHLLLLMNLASAKMCTDEELRRWLGLYHAWKGHEVYRVVALRVRKALERFVDSPHLEVEKPSDDYWLKVEGSLSLTS